jgi:hypothetical protein
VNKEEKPLGGPNFYQTLDIIPGASHNEILHAYTRAKMAYSKDSLASYSILDEESKSSLLEEVEKAFAILGNPAKRREYDLKMGFQTWSEGDSHSANGSSDSQMPPHMYTQRAEAPGPSSRVSQGLTRNAAQVDRSASQSRAEATVHVLHKVAAPESSPDFEANPDFEQKIAECTMVDGAFMKAVRIYRRLTQEQLANRCKLSTHHVITIEEEDAERMHAAVYLRGHVATLCYMLGLPNSEEIAKTYVARMRNLNKLPKNTF